MPVPMVTDSTARKRALLEVELARWKSPLDTALLVWGGKQRRVALAGRALQCTDVINVVNLAITRQPPAAAPHRHESWV